MSMPTNWPEGKYPVILADPPWTYKTYSDKGRDRCPDARHYGVMSLEDIKALPVETLLQANPKIDPSLLFLWVTCPLLPRAFEVAAAWGFEQYKTVVFAWMKHGLHDNTKPIMITGHWSRGNIELCLLFGRCDASPNPPRMDKGVPQAIWESRREHSRKPDAVYGRIQRLIKGPYLELFACSTVPGWTSWGLQAGKYGEVDVDSG